MHGPGRACWRPAPAFPKRKVGTDAQLSRRKLAAKSRGRARALCPPGPVQIQRQCPDGDVRARCRTEKLRAGRRGPGRRLSTVPLLVACMLRRFACLGLPRAGASALRRARAS